MHDTGATETLGRNLFTAQLVRSGVEVAQPERDLGVDLITYNANATWALPIQLKTIGLDGITVFRKYLDRPLGIVYLLLGDADGGFAGRTGTDAYLLTPEEAWGLPTALGKAFEPDFHTTYRFSSLTRALIEKLEEYRVQPGTWPDRLAALAPLRRWLPDAA